MIGPVKVIQVEDLIAERILTATYPQANSDCDVVARTLLAAVLHGTVSADFEELERVADSPSYRVGEELRRLVKELK